MTTPPAAVVLWTGTVPSGTFRLVDLGTSAPIRYHIEQQQVPDLLGGVGWREVGLPFADVLEAAFAAIITR
jgi:hypothetical protein